LCASETASADSISSNGWSSCATLRIASSPDWSTHGHGDLLCCAMRVAASRAWCRGRDPGEALVVTMRQGSVPGLVRPAARVAVMAPLGLLASLLGVVGILLFWPRRSISGAASSRRA
jgi:hypothetical protein